jgi:hypothetical protein
MKKVALTVFGILGLAASANAQGTVETIDFNGTSVRFDGH